MAKSAAKKMADYRRRKREQGLRQITLWVPDMRNPEVKEKLREEVRRLRGHPSTADGDMFLEAALAELAAELNELEAKKD